MSAFSLSTMSIRESKAFAPFKASLSSEARAVLYGAFIGGLILALAVFSDTSSPADLHSNTNVEDLRGETPAVDQTTPVRQRY